MLTYKRLKELIAYDPDTGLFTNLKNRGQRARKGEPAGGIDKQGYQRIWIDGRPYAGQRLAWLLMTGEWPENQVDHINGIRSDDRWANLRDVEPSINRQNQRGAHKNNALGVLGVTQRGCRFIAQLRINGKTTHIGRFASAQEAHNAYLDAKRANHPGCTL